MIFMQQMQYNAPSRMNVFPKFSGGDPRTPFGAVCCDPEPGPLSPPRSWLRACYVDVNDIQTMHFNIKSDET